MQKNREHANEQVTKVKNDIDERINELDKTQSENMDMTTNKFNEIKTNINTTIANLKDELLKIQAAEIKRLEGDVKLATEKVQQDNSGIYDRYDEKLKTIKDVCAQYFSKYEKILINHQTVVKDLEKQQEQWV